jgi:hypothetical protein
LDPASELCLHGRKPPSRFAKRRYLMISRSRASELEQRAQPGGAAAEKHRIA